MNLFCFFRCQETVPVSQPDASEKTSLLASLKTVFSNIYFWAGAAFQGLQAAYFVIVGTSLPYFCKYVLGNDGWLYSSLYMLDTLALIISMLFCPVLMRRFSKRTVSIAGLILSMAGQLILLCNPASLPLIFISIIARGIGYGPLNSVTFAFIGESVEYGNWKYNKRQENLICSNCTVVSKIASGVATAGITGLLAAAGYISASAETALVQSDSVLHMITNIYIFGPTLIYLLSLLVLFLYKLEKRLPAIMKDLAVRK